ncbi:MAG: DUF1275 domain-containing protein [Acidobacteriota bacterium]|nr:DUF1275 domain-containing protein [Acidobacteriota bacterium]
MSGANGVSAVLTLVFGFIGGYCDAVSYLLLKVFTGWVSGNLVLLSISIASKDAPLAFSRASAVLCFLIGTACAVLFELKPPHNSARSALSFRLALGVEAILIATAGVVFHSHVKGSHLLSLGCFCFALGLQNGTVLKIGGASVHTTFITGVFTKFLQAGAKDISAPVPVIQRFKNLFVDTQFKNFSALGLCFGFGALMAAALVHLWGPLALVVPAGMVLLIASLASRAQLRRGLHGFE